MCKITGIDVSKQTLDVAYFKQGQWYHFKTSNSINGFKKIMKISKAGITIMEASGPYSLALANYLYEHSCKVCVVNPLVIKRFSQMKFLRAKTDKKDAKTIAEYAMQHVDDLREWKPEQKVITQMQQILTAIKLYKKQIRQTKNQREAFKSTKLAGKQLLKQTNETLKFLQQQCKELEDQLKQLAHLHYADTIRRLKTIPGIGEKTAVLLVVLSNNFTKFDNYKQLIAYVGLSPRIYQSGTSIKGKGHICKMGRSDVRKSLYMCSWSAKRYNKACVEMYERLIAKGKPERVIKIAIANKLLKQSFALIKNNTVYQPDYCSILKPRLSH